MKSKSLIYVYKDYGRENLIKMSGISNKGEEGVVRIVKWGTIQKSKELKKRNHNLIK